MLQKRQLAQYQSIERSLVFFGVTKDPLPVSLPPLVGELTEIRDEIRALETKLKK